jgi:hypothetical protein
MAARDFVILVGPEGWRLLAVEAGSVRCEELAVAGDLLDRAGAEAVAAAVRDRGCRARGVALHPLRR